MTYFYPKFLEFQIMCRGPQMTPSRGPRVWDPCLRQCHGVRHLGLPYSATEMAACGIN